MVVAELLGMLGLGGQLVLAVSILVALWHVRSAILVLSRIGTLAWVGIVAVGLFVAAAFAMPGVDVVVSIGTVLGAIGDVIGGALDILSRGIGVSIEEVLP